MKQLALFLIVIAVMVATTVIIGTGCAEHNDKTAPIASGR